MKAKHITIFNNFELYSTGHVYSYRLQRFLKGTIIPDGYISYNLGKAGKHLAHVLVAQYFIPNPNNLPIVNHKDCNKLNPCMCNLEWCTYKENTQHAIKNGLRYKGKKVQQLTLSGTPIAIFNNVKSASIAIKGKEQTIRSNCGGHCNSAYGFKWQYVEVGE